MSAPIDAAPDMEYAHPGAPTQAPPAIRSGIALYAQPGALSVEFDTRTSTERHQAEIDALRSQVSTLRAALATQRTRSTAQRKEIAALRARLDRQEATD